MSDSPSAASALVRLPSGVLSHETAARLLGIELVQDTAQERITVPRSHGHARLAGWDVRRSDVPAVDVVQRPDGVRLTGPSRTVADLARVLPLGSAVAAADSALRARLLTREELTVVLVTQKGTGSARCRSVAGLVDPAAESVLESLLRVLFATAGLSRLRSQHAVFGADRRFIARVDFCWVDERLVVEADGFAFHSDRAAYRRDRERLNRLVAAGWRPLRVTWEDVVDRPSHVVELVRECLRTAAGDRAG
jgi:very-short-patch-repair endonuclease